MTEQPNSYDFRRPSAIPEDVGHGLDCWHAAVCSLTGEAWSKYASTAITIKKAEPTAERFAVMRQQLPEDSIGFRLSLDGNGLTSLLVMSRTLILALLAEMLGQGGEELPEDRELTPAERSLSELIFLEFCGAVSEAWPEQEPLTCELGAFESRPTRTRMFALDEHLLSAKFSIEGPFGTQTCDWLFPLEAITEFLSEPAEGHHEHSLRSRRELEAKSREIPIEMVVHLGHVKLHVAELANLQPGDVLVLDQRITDTLTAEVAGHRMLDGWAGRIGVRQAFQVQRLH